MMVLSNAMKGTTDALKLEIKTEKMPNLKTESSAPDMDMRFSASLN